MSTTKPTTLKAVTTCGATTIDFTTFLSTKNPTLNRACEVLLHVPKSTFFDIVTLLAEDMQKHMGKAQSSIYISELHNAKNRVISTPHVDYDVTYPKNLMSGDFTDWANVEEKQRERVFCFAYALDPSTKSVYFNLAVYRDPTVSSTPTPNPTTTDSAADQFSVISKSSLPAVNKTHIKVLRAQLRHTAAFRFFDRRFVIAFNDHQWETLAPNTPDSKGKLMKVLRDASEGFYQKMAQIRAPKVTKPGVIQKSMFPQTFKAHKSMGTLTVDFIDDRGLSKRRKFKATATTTVKSVSSVLPPANYRHLLNTTPEETADDNDYFNESGNK